MAASFNESTGVADPQVQLTTQPPGGDSDGVC